MYLWSFLFSNFHFLCWKVYKICPKHTVKHVCIFVNPHCTQKKYMYKKKKNWLSAVRAVIVLSVKNTCKSGWARGTTLPWLWVPGTDSNERYTLVYKTTTPSPLTLNVGEQCTKPVKLVASNDKRIILAVPNPLTETMTEKSCFWRMSEISQKGKKSLRRRKTRERERQRERHTHTHTYT